MLVRLYSFLEDALLTLLPYQSCHGISRLKSAPFDHALVCPGLKTFLPRAAPPIEKVVFKMHHVSMLH